MKRQPSDAASTDDNAEGTRTTKDLEWFFDCLDSTLAYCPVEGCKKHLVLSSMIVHLNDDHRLTREQIAEWLTLESNA